MTVLSGGLKLFGYPIEGNAERLIFRTIFNNKTYLYLVEKETGEMIGRCFGVDKEIGERVKGLISKNYER